MVSQKWLNILRRRIGAIKARDSRELFGNLLDLVEQQNREITKMKADLRSLRDGRNP
jgi:hypothetical protein